MISEVSNSSGGIDSAHYRKMVTVENSHAHNVKLKQSITIILAPEMPPVKTKIPDRFIGIIYSNSNPTQVFLPIIHGIAVDMVADCAKNERADKIMKLDCSLVRIVTPEGSVLTTFQAVKAYSLSADLVNIFSRNSSYARHFAFQGKCFNARRKLINPDSTLVFSKSRLHMGTQPKLLVMRRTQKSSMHFLQTPLKCTVIRSWIHRSKRLKLTSTPPLLVVLFAQVIAVEGSVTAKKGTNFHA